MTTKQKYDYYQLLGLPKTATSDEIKTAYKELAQIYHPDSNFYGDLVEGSLLELSEEQSNLFKNITSAYHTLINDELRKEYDQSIGSQLNGWTETKIVVAPEAVDKAKRERPYAYGTFGKVAPKSKTAADLKDIPNCKPVSEILFSQKKSFFSRLCEIFGV
ncbi:MAG: DnaJ domain-containing protein [Bdellovibrionales bacterium]|nr:DnaJ domain-containing protein [Bdellovibrionales bacterium]